MLNLITKLLTELGSDLDCDHRVFLVGSLPRGEFVCGRSDIDILVVLRKVNASSLSLICKWVKVIEEDYCVHVGVTLHLAQEIEKLSSALEVKTLVYLHGICNGVYNSLSDQNISLSINSSLVENEIFSRVKEDLSKCIFSIRRTFFDGYSKNQLVKNLELLFKIFHILKGGEVPHSFADIHLNVVDAVLLKRVSESKSPLDPSGQLFNDVLNVVDGLSLGERQ